MTTTFHLPRRAIVLGVSIGIAILAFSTRLVVDLRDDTWSNAQRAGNDAVASVSHDLARSLATYDLSLRHVVDEWRTPGVMELPTDLRDRVLFDGSANATYLGAILVVDARGHVVIDSRHRLPSRDAQVDDESLRYHRDHADAGLHIGRPSTPADGGPPTVTLSRRLESADGGFAGVVVGTIELAYFRDTFLKLDLGPDGGLALTLADGTMLMRFPYRDRDVGRDVAGNAVFARIAASARGSFVAVSGIDGVERLYTFTQVGDLPLHLAAAQAVGPIAESWHRRAWPIAFLTIGLLAGCATLAVILTKELRRREQVERRLFAQGERLRVTLNSIGDAVVTTDVDGVVTYLNPVAERMSGWTSDAARGRHAHDVLVITTSDSGERVPNPIRIALAEQRVVGLAADSVLHRHGGGTFAIEDSAAPIRDRDGATVGAVMVFHDVSEARAMAHRMSHLAQHDALTDLPNRVLLQDRLEQAIERGHRNATQAALLFLDLDRFKSINDSLGHGAGDRLLIATAERLRACVRDSDTVSRVGGDEFVVLLSDLSDAQGPGRVARKVLAAMGRPFELAGQSIDVGASIGIAVYPRDGTTVDALTRAADAAMYLAKQSGRNGFRFFTSELGEQETKRIGFERALADGLKRSEFVLHYQPQYRSEDDALIGIEALVRWKRDGALLQPSEFLPLAEACGQIVELGDAILTMACRQAVRWRREGRAPFTLSVNVFAQQFRAPGFAERVAAVLDATGLDARRLELEITETTLAAAGDRAEAILRQLKQVGVRIALDDFGTGYSSLDDLRRFPVDRIKIDRSFVKALASSRSDTAIVRAVIDLGRGLGLRVLAEGVETVEQRRVLRTLGCEEVQGFLTGRPCAAEEVVFARDAEVVDA